MPHNGCLLPSREWHTNHSLGARHRQTYGGDSLPLVGSRQIEITVEVPGGDSSVWAPFLRYRPRLRPEILIGQAVHAHHGRLNGLVVNRKDVEPPQREHQKHLGGPSTYALYHSKIVKIMDI